MATQQGPFGARGIRTALALSVVAVLAASALWRGVAAQHSSPPAPAIQAPVAAVRDGVITRNSYADVVKAVATAVVTIRVEGRAQPAPTAFQDDDLFRRFFGDQFGDSPRGSRSFKQRGLGSGVIVSADGYILTNHHVVNGADDIRVDLADGRTFKASLIGSDAPSDLALIKITAPNLHALALGNSDAVEVGDVVLALGNPLGIGQTVTMGIVSAKGRSTGLGDGGYEDFLQTDAPINQGNSGGALVSTKGELIGINSQIVSPSGGNIGIGFAIPANMASHVMTELRTNGQVRRAQLGITVQAVTADVAASLNLPDVTGAIVSAVTPDSPADRAGVKRGDVILSFNGQAVKDSNTLRNRVAGAGPGSRARLLITREGRQRELAVTLGEAAAKTARLDGATGSEADRQTALGVAVAPLTPELAQEMGLPKQSRGLVVQDVTPDGRAASAGLQPGDVIEEVNQQPVQTVEALRNAVRHASDRPLLLLVNREGKELFLTARTS